MTLDGVKELIDDLPPTVNNDVLSGLGWSTVASPATLVLTNGPVQLVFNIMPFGPKMGSMELDLAKIIVQVDDNYLRYVDSESPYAKAIPDLDYWGGHLLVKELCDSMCLKLRGTVFVEQL